METDDKKSLYTYRDVDVHDKKRSISKEIEDAKHELESTYSPEKNNDIELDYWKMERLELGNKVRIHIQFKVKPVHSDIKRDK